MLTIASLTFKEALRKKILIAAVILTLLFLTLYSTGLYYMNQDLEKVKHNNIARESEENRADAIERVPMMIEQQKKMFLLMGIYLSSSIVSLLAVFSSVGSVSSEVENGMLHAIMAKPIRRRDIILGKFIGFALMLTAYAALLFVSVLMLNHYIADVKLTGISSTVGLFILQPLVLLTVTIAGSARFSTLANGITAFMLYMIGVIGGMIEWFGAAFSNGTLVYAGIIASLIMPVDSLYRMISSSIIGSSSGLNVLSNMMYGPFGTLSEPSAAMIIYTLIYMGALLLVAMRVFSRRDIG